MLRFLWLVAWLAVATGCAQRPADWPRQMLGEEPELAVVVDRRATASDQAFGKILEALIALSYAASLCESDAVVSQALLRARGLEMYASGRGDDQRSVVVLREVPADLSLDQSSLYRLARRRGSARVYLQQTRAQPSHALYVLGDGTWVFSSNEDDEAIAGGVPAFASEPGVMVSAQVSRALLEMESDPPGRALMPGLESVAVTLYRGSDEEPMHAQLRMIYASEDDAAAAEREMGGLLATGIASAIRREQLAPALLTAMSQALRAEREGRELVLQLRWNRALADLAG